MKATELAQILRNMDLLMSCEEAVMDFYQACAEAWPREREFWGDLAADELVHTTRLQLMRDRAEGSAHAARSIRIFPPAALATFRSSVEGSRERVQSRKISHREALAIARDLERSPIVNNHYLVARSAEPGLANYLLSFATDYGEHSQLIEERLNRAVTMERVA